jgi:hypothetical protein
MPDIVNSQITDAITLTNADLKAISERLTTLLDRINVRLSARSAVDVLTNNQLADEIAFLKAAVDALATVKPIQRPR